ncbi:MAG: hypothetical protein E7773_14270 [Sphingomonas sp.]|uniref:hypothetical protein n=1 Tax=Sphingomonas sp. TaxID=28214 RepID=UPI00120FCCA5|nr:hypothetical protein [Sphingomonas sp.]THD34820.1 MAG: hypothetical protein E7773_14270 [Sphingomonas sp.]
MAFSGDKADRLLKILAVRLNVKSDKIWLHYLGYAAPSSLSRIRSGKAVLPEAKLNTLCDLCEIDRSDLDLPPAELAAKLGVASKLPSELLTIDKEVPARRVHDDEHILLGHYFLIYPGRDYRTDTSDVFVIERLSFARKGNERVVEMVENFVTDASSTGRCSFHGEIGYISIGYASDYPPSTIIARPMLVSARREIHHGLYLDVSPRPNMTTFATECCIFRATEPLDMPRLIHSGSAQHAAWQLALPNDMKHRRKLVSSYSEETCERLRAAVILTEESFNLGLAVI